MIKTSSNAKKKSVARTKHFKALEKYMASVAAGNMRKHKLFTLCVKASVCKCFEFNLAVPQIAKTGNAFFGVHPYGASARV